MSGIAGWKKVAEGWGSVDAFIAERLLGDDPALAAALALSAEAGLPDIAVTPAQGKFLELLVRITGAKHVLEIGTLGGYSTIHLARGVGEGGSVTTLEARPSYAEVARQNIAAAGLAERIDVLIGPALKTLPGLAGPYDLTFIDADKPNNVNYVEAALALSRPGSLIVVDNVVREGNILDPALDDESALGTRALYEHIAGHTRLESTVLQTVGEKGWDGMMFLRVLG